MSEVSTIYEIPAANLDNLMGKIEKVSKKSKKINGTSVRLNVLEEIRKPAYSMIDGQFRRIHDEDGNPVYNLFFKVSCDAAPVKIAGYTFIATIDHQTSGNLLRVSPNVDCVIPEKYRTIGPMCDHCKMDRKRRDTFLLRCDADGSLKQIGRQCLRDYIGYDVKTFLALAECNGDVAYSMGNCDEDDGPGGMRDRRFIRVHTFLVNVSAVMRKYGWCSKKDADIQMRSATADDAIVNMFRKPGSSKSVPLIDQDFDTAEAALEWAQNLPGRNDFEHNMKVLANESMIESRSIGILAYVIPGMLRAKEREFLQKARKASLALTESQHVGNVGDKLKNISAVLYGYNTVDGTYGTTTIYKFRSDDGNVFVWFSSQGVEGLGSAAAVQHQPVILSGTVKKHGEYENVKQTILTRCKVQIVEQAEEAA